ncbi:hypothetical protein FOA52_003835 [Chlamydomonas sp. UWO 241]|nr:hypothetical protein FOA52_003835 [Chlamydomonas sp. UWO 241]
MARFTLSLYSVCNLLALVLATQASLASATARLGASSTTTTIRSDSTTTPAVPDASLGAQQRIVSVAATSLTATFSSIDTENPFFPDVIDARTGAWHTDDISANGAAGLLAGCLWSMHQLTGDDTWRSHALAASAALRPAVGDVSLGQAIGTLAYPALRYAYEATEADPAERATYLNAALTAADALSRLYTRIPGVLKVRPTDDIAKEARAAGAAAVSPLAVFSSPEGSSAAAGLLTWAATLPGGRPAWADMAAANARRIAADHVRADGTVRGILVYKATSARAVPFELAPESAPATALLTTASTITAVLADDGSIALDQWLSSVAGLTPSVQLRQALTTLALADAAAAAMSSPTTVHGAADDAETLLAAAESTASHLLDAIATDASSLDPAAAAAAASALSTLSTLCRSQAGRDAYAGAARALVVALAADRLPASSASSSASSHYGIAADAELFAAAASRWVSALLRGAPSPAAATSDGGINAVHSTAMPASILACSGSRSGGVTTSTSRRPDADGQGGSMLADHLLLQALVKMTAADATR